jgi:ATP-dependent DNA helicase RecG
MELENIKGIGPKMRETLANLNINSIQDLLEYYPYRYNFIVYKNINELESEPGYLKCHVLTDAKAFSKYAKKLKKHYLTFLNT